MSNPLISVIAAVRNGGPLLMETIASIQEQTVSDWEFLIVDDASTDDTPDYIDRAMRLDPRIRMIRRETSGGPYVAANDALAQATGTWVMRTDADDLSPPHRFARQLEFLQANPYYKACVTFWQPFNENGLLPRVVPMPTQPRVLLWFWMLRSASIHSSACFSLEAMREIGGYAPFPMSQDYRLWCELTRRGWLGVIPEPLSYVRQHSGRITHARRDLQRQLALHVLDDHLRRVTGERWRPEDVEALFQVGHSETLEIGRGLDMLSRWDTLWKADTQLSDDDRRELHHISALRRWKHIRSNARSQPLRALSASVAQVLRQPASWTEAREAMAG